MRLPAHCQNICCVYTPYALLLYLLQGDEHTTEHTFFVFPPSMPSSIARNLPYCAKYQLPTKQLKGRWWSDWLAIRRDMRRHLPTIPGKATLFMQDHHHWAQIYAGHHPYTFIEDSAGCCSRHRPADYDNFFCFRGNSGLDHLKESVARRCCRILYGDAFDRAFAKSATAHTLLLSQDDPSPYLAGRKRQILPRLDSALWQSLSETHRTSILHIFDVHPLEAAMLGRRDNLLLTQPLYPDSISRDEHRRIYADIIRRYGASTITIKPHPRDRFDYREAFPECAVIESAAPLELLNMSGGCPRRAVTVYSTSVGALDCEIHWYGTEVSPRLFQRCGHFPEPNLPNLMISKLPTQ